MLQKHIVLTVFLEQTQYLKGHAEDGLRNLKIETLTLKMRITLRKTFDDRYASQHFGRKSIFIRDNKIKKLHC